MPKILIQTTICASQDGWHVSDFSELAAVLRNDGNVVVERDRQPGADGSDPVLSTLPESNFDQLWLLAADRGNALAPADVRGILRFRERGGGVLTARDRENLGSSLLNLGTLGAVNNFASYNRERGRRVRRQSGLRGEYHRIVPLEPVHEILRSSNSPTGLVEYFPANPNEGAISVPRYVPNARAIAASTSVADGREFDVAIAIENERAGTGEFCGRGIAVSSVHYFSNADWAMAAGGEHLEVYKDYVRNIARWLSS